MNVHSPTAAESSFLVLAPTGRDAALTCALLHKEGLPAQPCKDFDDLWQRASGEDTLGLLIAEEGLTPSAVSRLHVLLESQETWSDLPILIFRRELGSSSVRPAIATLISELGNVTLLDRPLQRITMVSAAHAAARSRRRQFSARAALEGQQLAVRQRDQFLAMLGHELRNPLAAISLASQLEQESESPNYGAVIQRQTVHLTRLVDDLLDVSRVTSGKIVLQRGRLDLGEVLRHALETLRATLSTQDLTLSVHTPDEPVWVDADVVRLEQIVVNLIGNAAKYTPHAGHLRVTISAPDEQAVISVQDDGVGIDPEMLPRVFELFAQAEGSLDRAKGGMGIGLTLVRSLVELHGGSVEAHSDGLGCGSEFVVKLPLAPESSRPSSPPSPPAVTKAGGERRVLIVEDNDDSRELLASMLERRGHCVITAADGRQGVALALSERPEIILVDIGLPDLDGYGVARRVRTVLADDVFLVALTGYGQPEDRVRAFEAGFDIHLTKPIDFRVLQELLQAPEQLRQSAYSAANAH